MPTTGIIPQSPPPELRAEPLPEGCDTQTIFHKIVMDAYTEAHLVVAAIRILQHQKRTPPKLEEVCSLLAISDEAGHSCCRNLAKLGIIEVLEDPFSLNLTVANHLEIEKIPKNEQDGKGLARELEQFQAKKMKEGKKIADIQAEMAKKKQDMLSAIESKFKKEMEKFKKE
ncbi:MAG: hypothetical protein P4L42_16285 [Desulfocapsaceae bacterium]|nr:hypothetical protein [Desulfocapsaceae bacterium]